MLGGSSMDIVRAATRTGLACARPALVIDSNYFGDHSHALRQSMLSNLILVIDLITRHHRSRPR